MPGDVTATHIGGCGFWIGFGSTARSGIENARPCQLNRSCVHIFGITRTNSSQVFLVSSAFARNPPSSVHVADRPVPSSTPSAGEDVEDRGALRDADRALVLRHARDDTVADADALGLHRAGGEEEVGRGAVRVLLEEVVLDRPDVVEAQFVGEAHLLQRVLVGLSFRVARPGAGDRELHEQAEFHGHILRAASPIC